MHQMSYLGKLRDMHENASYYDYRSFFRKLVWSTNTRPDVCCSVAKFAQATEESFENEKLSGMKEINKIVEHLKKFILHNEISKIE